MESFSPAIPTAAPASPARLPTIPPSSPNRDAIHGTQNYCFSATGSTSYACRISNGTLAAYSTGMTFVLVVDVPCNTKCSLNVDALGPVSIKRSDGVTDPGGTLAAGQPQWVFYDGKVFRLMGGGGRLARRRWRRS